MANPFQLVCVAALQEPSVQLVAPKYFTGIAQRPSIGAFWLMVDADGSACSMLKAAVGTELNAEVW